MEDVKDFEQDDWYIEARSKLIQLGVSAHLIRDFFPKDCDKFTSELIMEHIMSNIEDVKRM